MHNTNLLTVAVRSLEDPTSSAPVCAIAVECLSAALSEGLSLPRGAPWLLWVWTKTLRSQSPWNLVSRLAECDAPEVRDDALSLAASHELGGDLLRWVTTLLGGSAHSEHVTDRHLTSFVEIAAQPEQVRHVASLVEAVHLARGLDASFRRAIRDRWARSELADLRRAAVELDVDVTDDDVGFFAKMLVDPSRDVRAAAATRLGDVAEEATEASAKALHARLGDEPGQDVRAAIFRALASLLEEPRGGRWRPRGR